MLPEPSLTKTDGSGDGTRSQALVDLYEMADWRLKHLVWLIRPPTDEFTTILQPTRPHSSRQRPMTSQRNEPLQTTVSLNLR